jgi:hypothetical protein
MLLCNIDSAKMTTKNERLLKDLVDWLQKKIIKQMLV